MFEHYLEFSVEIFPRVSNIVLLQKLETLLCHDQDNALNIKFDSNSSLGSFYYPKTQEYLKFDKFLFPELKSLVFKSFFHCLCKVHISLT